MPHSSTPLPKLNFLTFWEAAAQSSQTKAWVKSTTIWIVIDTLYPCTLLDTFDVLKSGHITLLHHYISLLARGELSYSQRVPCKCWLSCRVLPERNRSSTGIMEPTIEQHIGPPPEIVADSSLQDLVAMHRRQIEKDMAMVRREMSLLTQASSHFPDPQSCDDLHGKQVSFQSFLLQIITALPTVACAFCS